MSILGGGRCSREILALEGCTSAAWAPRSEERVYLRAGHRHHKFQQKSELLRPRMASITLHLRSETKPLEHRSALTPTVVRKLLDKGFKVNVERSQERIFDDAEFESVSATLVPEGSWPNAPKDHIIIGLKEVRLLA